MVLMVYVVYMLVSSHLFTNFLFFFFFFLVSFLLSFYPLPMLYAVYVNFLHDTLPPYVSLSFPFFPSLQNPKNSLHVDHDSISTS